MDGLLQEQRDARSAYRKELEAAARDPNPSKRTQTLVELNRTLSMIVNRMQAELAQQSEKVNLDDVQSRLSQELMSIQQDAQRFRDTRDQRETIQRIQEQAQGQHASQSRSLQLQMAALLVAVVLLLVSILRATWISLTPAMPPLAEPVFTSEAPILQ